MNAESMDAHIKNQNEWMKKEKERKKTMNDGKNE